MKPRVLCVVLIALTLPCASPRAQAGFIRHLARKIRIGSQHVAGTTAEDTRTVGARAQSVGKSAAGAARRGASATKSGAETAAGGVEGAGTRAGETLKTGAANAAEGVKQAPRAGAHGTKAAVQRIWKVIW